MVSRRAERRLVRLMIGAALASPCALAAQSVALRISPKVGDTLRARFDEQHEMTLATKMKNVDTSMTVKSIMVLLARTVVKRRDESGTDVTTVTDSVALSGSRGGVAQSVPEAARRAYQGHRIDVHFTPQGVATVVEGANDMPTELQSLTAQMPATLPPQTVTVGQTWTQAMLVPIPSQFGNASAATMRTVYRLDSLGHSGAIAYISMNGIITRDSSAADIRPGTKMVSNGSISGVLMIDRKRGWWSGFVFTMVVHSTLVDSTNPEPVHFET
ncbi:MAG: DUF6263 family protein, partial [Gemmatimonadota bacterium]|nr:DUF6263 family protein [Gemmatimonadota bacterium]